MGTSRGEIHLLLRSVKTQFRLMVNKRNFWVAIFLGLFYCIISYAHSLYIYRDMMFRELLMQRRFLLETPIRRFLKSIS